MHYKIINTVIQCEILYIFIVCAIMLHIIHIQYADNTYMTYMCDFSHSSLSLHCSRVKTNVLGKQCLLNVFIKTQHFLIYRKSHSQQEMKINNNLKQNALFTFLSHQCQKDGCSLPCTFHGLCSWFIYFGPITFWNPLSSTHFWHNPVKMWQFITQRSKRAADNSETMRSQEASTPARQQTPSTILARLRNILVFDNFI